MTRVALVVQRYGAEMNGGSERLARSVAKTIDSSVDLTVVSTCALDYATWANHYPPGETRIDGIRVRRFAVTEERTPGEFERLSLAAYAAPDDLELGAAWLRAQGPNAPELVEHVATGDYDAVLFITYLYASTAQTLPLVADRALLVPTVHDEPPLRLAIFDNVFHSAQVLIFSTEPERALALQRFRVDPARTRLAPVTIEPPLDADTERFRAAHGVHRPYVLYVGRLDDSKGVSELVAHHQHYRAQGGDLDLVLVGSGPLRPPERPWLRSLGYLSEEDKHAAVAGAEVVALPSPYESLSLSQLEAWSHGKPTLANAGSSVLLAQSRRGGGGLWYRNADEYSAALQLLVSSPALAAAIGRQGRRFVEREYTPERAKEAWVSAVLDVANRRPRAS